MIDYSLCYSKFFFDKKYSFLTNKYWLFHSACLCDLNCTNRSPDDETPIFVASKNNLADRINDILTL